MPTQSHIRTPEDAAETGKRVGTSTLNNGTDTVHRQHFCVADPDTAAALATVKSAHPAATDYGVVVRQVGGQATTVTPLNDVTVTNVATQIRFASTSRVALNITNLSGSTGVRWGDSSVTATKGQRIGPGQSAQITATAAVFMISEDVNVSISLTEETL